MNYQESFKKMIDTYGYEILNDNTMMRNYLSDLIGSSFLDVRLLNSFYLLNKDSDLYRSIQNLSLKESKDYIKTLIVKSGNGFTIEDYIKSVEPLLLLMYPNEYVPYKGSGSVKQIRKKTPENGGYDPVIALVRAIKPKTDNLSINANTESLVVTMGASSDIRIIKGKKDVTHLFNVSNSIDIVDSQESYIIEVPRKDLLKIDISYTGNKLSVLSKTKKRFTVDKLNINSNSGDTYIDGNINHLNITQSNGDINIIGKTNTINISASLSNIQYAFTKGTPKRVNITTGWGNININLMGKTIKPKINHLLFPVRSVFKECLVGKKKVIFNLTTSKGRISVR